MVDSPDRIAGCDSYVVVVVASADTSSRQGAGAALALGWRSFWGPYHEGDLGLPGSAEFADRHTRRPLLAPVVRLVLTGSTFEIVPASGKNQPMSVPLESISEVAIARGPPKANGVTITTRTGRVATFLMKPNEVLDAQLERLGATVSRV